MDSAQRHEREWHSGRWERWKQVRSLGYQVPWWVLVFSHMNMYEQKHFLSRLPLLKCYCRYQTFVTSRKALITRPFQWQQLRASRPCFTIVCCVLLAADCFVRVYKISPILPHDSHILSEEQLTSAVRACTWWLIYPLCLTGVTAKMLRRRRRWGTVSLWKTSWTKWRRSVMTPQGHQRSVINVFAYLLERKTDVKNVTK